MTSHKKGRLWVKQELRQKGIGTELISEALGEISADAELRARLPWDGKWRNPWRDAGSQT